MRSTLVHSTLKVLVVGLAGWLVANVAKADEITITETGTVTSYTPFPGDTPPSIIDDPFTLTIVDDPTAFTPLPATTGGCPARSACYVSPSTQGSTTISIFGQSATSPNTYSSYVFMTDEGSNGLASGLGTRAGNVGSVSSSISAVSTPIPNAFSTANLNYATNVNSGTMHLLGPQDNGPLDIYQSIGGNITNLTITNTPSPSLYLTVNTGGPNGQPTAITANLTLATTPPSLPGTTVPLPFALPSYVATLQQAAVAINPDFVGVDWEQTWLSLPSPSPLYSNANPFAQITAPPFSNDPPFEGYIEGGGAPFCSYTVNRNLLGMVTGYTYNYSAAAMQAYPFYYAPTGPAGDCFSLSTAVNPADTVLSFGDMPSDSCLPGGSGLGCSGETDLAGSELAFETQLVGIIPIADASDFSDPNCNSLTVLCAVPFGPSFFWTDTFNGTTGDVSVPASTLPVDADSGSGGITVLSVNASVPEPPSILLLALPLLLLVFTKCKGTRARQTINLALKIVIQHHTDDIRSDNLT